MKLIIDKIKLLLILYYKVYMTFARLNHYPAETLFTFSRTSVGMYNGAIDNTQISCSKEEVFNSFCGACHKARYNVNNNFVNSSLYGHYWCTSSGQEYMKISFSSLVYVESVLIETLAIENDATKYAAQFLTIHYAVGDSEDDNFIPIGFPNVKVYSTQQGISISKILNHLKIQIHERFTDFPKTAYRFELYGWPYWKYARALGMKSGAIKGSFISSHGSENSALSPQHARLQLNNGGWLPKPLVGTQSLWLQFKLNKVMKIVYIAVQNKNPLELYQVNNFSVSYGENEASMHWYVSEENPSVTKIVYPPNHVLDVEIHHVFWYPLYGNIIRYYPYCTVNCAIVNIELYGVPRLTPDHQWLFQGKNVEDTLTLQEFDVKGTRILLSEYNGLLGTEEIRRYYEQSRSASFQNDDCIVNPDNCKAGLSLSFWTDGFVKPSFSKRTIISDMVTTSILGGCRLVGKTASHLRYEEGSLGVYFKTIPVDQYQITDLVFIFGPFQLISITGSHFGLKVFLNVEKEFVSTCGYNDTQLKPFYEGSLIFTTNGARIEAILDFKEVFKSASWMFDSSVALVISPVNNTEMSLKADSSYKFSNRIDYEYDEKCEVHDDKIIQNLPPENFNQTKNTPCLGTEAHHASFKYNGWVNCDEQNNVLKIDLGRLCRVAMLKIAAANMSGVYYLLKSFYLYYSTNKNGKDMKAFARFPGYSDTSINTFSVDEYSIDRPLYIALPYVLTTRWIQINPVTNYGGLKPGLRIDIVECQLKPDTLASKWIKLNDNPVCFKGKDNSPGIFQMQQGLDVSAFKLVHTSGYISCGWGLQQLHFGCFNNSIGVAVLFEDKEFLAPLEKTGPSYTIDGYQYISDNITIPSKPTYLATSEKLFVWFLKDFLDYYEQDNVGESCVDVFGWGKPTSGRFITKKCFDVYCPCIAVNKDLSLIYSNTICDEHSFYFTSKYCMVHIQSSKFVTITEGRYILTNNCTDKFKVGYHGKIVDARGKCFGVNATNSSTIIGLNVSASTVCFEFDFFDEPNTVIKKNEVEFAKRRYIVDPLVRTFTEAEHYCTLKNGLLPTFNSMRQVMIAQEVLNLYYPNSSFWVYAKDINKDSQYIAIDNSPVLFSRWKSSNPTAEECLQISDSRFLPAPCNGKSYALCEVSDNVGAKSIATFISSGVFQTRYLTFGRGFHIGVQQLEDYNASLNVIVRTETENYELRYKKTNKDWEMFTIIWVKGQNLTLFVNDKKKSVVNAVQNIKLNGVKIYPEVIIPTNFLILGSSHDLVYITLLWQSIHDFRVWRNVLTINDIEEMFSYTKIDFSEADFSESDGQSWKFESGCSDFESLTGPCSDVDSQDIIDKPHLSVVIPIFHAQISDNSQCASAELVTKFPALNTRALFGFQSIAISRYDVITSAYIKFKAASSSNFRYSYHISLISSSVCTDLTQFKYYDLIDPVTWNITEWNSANESYSSPDVSSLLNYMKNKKSWMIERTVYFAFTESKLNAVDVSTSMANHIYVNQISLEIFFQSYEPSRYLFFPSKSMSRTANYETVEFGAFHHYVKAVSFWIYMRGPDVGILFVWQYNEDDDRMLYIKHGEVGNYWQQISVRTYTFTRRFKLRFNVFNNFGVKGHIAIDNIEVFNKDTDIQFTDTPSLYQYDDKISYRTVLEKLEYPQPTLLYPFARNFDDYGKAGHDLDYTPKVISLYPFVEDKFLYNNHSLSVSLSIFKKSLWTSLSDSVTEFSQEFSIFLHVKLSLQSSYSTDKPVFSFGESDSVRKLILAFTEQKAMHLRIIKESQEFVIEGQTNLDIGKWYYIGVLYGDNKIKLYVDTVLDGISDVDMSLLNPFPNTLRFLTEKKYIENKTASGGDHFFGELSCFQAYNKTLTTKEMQMLEFCPNRQGEMFLKPKCSKNAGHFVLSPFCVCSEFVNRYVLPSCENGLSSSLYNDSAIYVSFDEFDQVLGEKQKFQLSTSNVTEFVPSPVNNGFCVCNNLSDIGVVSDDCLTSFTGCPHGLSISFWMFVSHNASDVETEIFHFSGMKLFVEPFESRSLNASFVIQYGPDCIVSTLVWGIQTWSHFVFIITPDAKITVYHNGEKLKTTSCSITAATQQEHTLSIGGLTKVCIDEFAVTYVMPGVDYGQIFYTNLVTGNITSDKELTQQYTVISVTMAISIMNANVNDYEAAFIDENSQQAIGVMRLFKDFLSVKMAEIKSSYIACEVANLRYEGLFIPDGKNVIPNAALVDVNLKFSYFSFKDSTFFSAIKFEKFTFRDSEFYFYGGWSPVVGIERALDINAVSLSPDSADLILPYRLQQRFRYLHGYHVQLTRAVARTGENINRAFFFQTGRDVLTFTGLQANRQYNFTIWSVTHEGYSTPSNTTVTVAPDVNYMPISNLTATKNRTSLRFEWKFDPEYSNHPILQFKIFYQPVNKSFNYTEISDFSNYNITVVDDVRLYILKGLKVFTNYSIYIASTNPVGDGPIAGPYFWRTAPGAPEIIPAIDFSLSGISNGVIKWELLDNDIELFNSFELDGVTIIVEPIFPGYQNYVEKIELNETTGKVILGSRDEFWLYKASISFRNLVGIGPGAIICYATKEISPNGVLQKANVSEVTSTSVRLKFGSMALIFENGVILHYRISYKNQYDGDKVQHIYTPPLEHAENNRIFWSKMANITMNCSDITLPPPYSSLVTEYNIEHLLPYTYYEFNVTGCTIAGCAPSYDPFFAGATLKTITLPSTPVCYLNFTMTNTSSTSMKISWKNFTDSCINGYITQFNVVLLRSDIYTNITNNSTITFDDIPIDNIELTTNEEYVFEDLDVFTNYTAFLFIENQVEMGPASPMKWALTDIGEPDLIPELANISMVDNNSYAFIQWNEPIHDIFAFNSFDLHGFTLIIKPLFLTQKSSDRTKFTFTTNITSVTISNDNPFQLFKLSLSVFNSVGSGPFLTACFVMGEKKPWYGAFNIAEVLNVTNSDAEIRIGNLSLSYENGIITHYLISYTSFYMTSPETLNATILVHSDENLLYWSKMKNGVLECSEFTLPNPQSSSVINYKISNLTPNINYEFSVFACNIKGCSDHPNANLSLVTLEGAPTCAPRFNLTSNKSTELIVTWLDTYEVCYNGVVLKYYLVILNVEEHYDLIGSGLAKATDIPVAFDVTNKTMYSYTGLKKYWNYTVAMFLGNAIDDGPLSEFQFALTLEDTPDGPPENFSAEAINSKKILIRVELPDRYVRNGIILGYRVYAENNFNETVELNFSEADPFKIMQNLRPFSTYQIKVSAYTAVGNGPYTTTLGVKTFEDVPSKPPSNFSTIASSNDTIQFSWNEVNGNYINGEPKYFIVMGSGKLSNGSIHNTSVFIIPYSGSMKKYQLSAGSLFPGTIYYFTIVACTTPGCGVSRVIEVGTSEMEPSGTVNCSHIQDTSKTTIRFSVQLSDPMAARGVITQYKVTYQRQDDIKKNLTTVYFWGNLTEIMLTELDNYVYYNINISALNSVGEGPVANYVFMTNENRPSMSPLNVIGHNISSTAVHIEFTSIPASNHEGILLGYNVYYEETQIYMECLSQQQPNSTCNPAYITINLNEYSLDIMDLALHTNYTICVAGFTSAGEGPKACVFIVTDTFVNGNWSEWTNWGYCDQSCAGGNVWRYRWCNNPEPERGGSNCTGKPVEKMLCNDFPCPGLSYLALPNVDCEKTCKSIDTNFSCYPTIETHDSINAFQVAIDPTNYTNVLDIQCHVNNITSKYSKTIHPVFDILHNECQGFKDVPKKISCQAPDELSGKLRRLCNCIDEESLNYLPWAQWSLCSKSCGVGSRNRFRTCIVEPSLCTKEIQTQDCNVDLCPVDGIWGNWGNFSDCDKTCGFGSRVRRRYCNNPKPQFGGKNCAHGVNHDIILGCNPLPCPIDGQWGSWSQYEHCTHPCGPGGKRLKRRYCDRPKPQFGGSLCQGSSYYWSPCNEHIQCKEIDATFIVKLLDEKWNYRMHYTNTKEFENISHKYEPEVTRIINSTQLVKFKVNHLSRGSVIMNFTTYLNQAGGLDLLKLHHNLDVVKQLGIMSIEYVDSISYSIPYYPPELFGRSNSPFSVDLFWNDDGRRGSINGEFYGYYIHYRLINDSYFDYNWTIYGTINSSVTIPDLLPASLYGFRLAVANTGARGLASFEKQISTLEGVPYIAPPNFKYISTNARRTYFSWDMIPANQIPGKLRGWLLTYRKYYSNSTETINLFDGIQEQTVYTLDPCSWYWVEICGYTYAGCGPKSVLVFKTSSSGPGIAPNVTIVDRISTNMMTIQWQPIPEELHYSENISYKIHYELVQHSGMDVIVGSQTEHIVTADKFTYSVDLHDLLPYGTYKITVYGSSKEGEGPKFISEGSTCKCPKDIYSIYYNFEPYVSVTSNVDLIEGIFPSFIPGIIYNVCTNCRSYKHPNLYFNKTATGHPPQKLTDLILKNSIDKHVHLSFPLLDRSTLPLMFGQYPYVTFLLTQGSAMIVYYEKVVGGGLLNVLSGVVSAYPVILIGVLLSFVFGCLFWLAERTAPNDSDFESTTFKGILQGAWLAFVTMTTVGYGDFANNTNASKAIMCLWIFTGLVLTSLFMGTVSSNMTISNVDSDIKLYDTKTAVVKDSSEMQLAVRRNAIVTNDTIYNNTLDVLKAVQRRKVVVGLIDAITAGHYKDLLPGMNLQLYKIISQKRGYGVALSGGLEYIAEDFKSYLLSEMPEIQKIMDEHINNLQPDLEKSEIEFLSKKDMMTLIFTCCEILAVLSALGSTYQLVRICLKRRKSKTAVSPEADNPLNSLILFSAMSKVVDDFQTSFKQKLANLKADHEYALLDLLSKRTNFARYLKKHGADRELIEKYKKMGKKRAYKKSNVEVK